MLYFLLFIIIIVYVFEVNKMCDQIPDYMLKKREKIKEAFIPSNLTKYGKHALDPDLIILDNMETTNNQDNQTSNDNDNNSRYATSSLTEVDNENFNIRLTDIPFQYREDIPYNWKCPINIIKDKNSENGYVEVSLKECHDYY